jgi:hypothetical protein
MKRRSPGAAGSPPRRQGDLDTGAVFAVRRIVRLFVVTANRRFLWWFRQTPNRRLLWWFRQTRAVAAQLGVVVLGFVARDDDGERSAAEEASAALRYGRHLVGGQRDQL